VDIQLSYMCVVHIQNAIASHDSNGLDIIIALVLSDINPLGKHRIDLVLGLKVCGRVPLNYLPLNALYALHCTCAVSILCPCIFGLAFTNKYIL